MLAQFVWNWRSSIRVITSAERAQLLISGFVPFGGIGFQVAILGSRPSITTHQSGPALSLVELSGPMGPVMDLDGPGWVPSHPHPQRKPRSLSVCSLGTSWRASNSVWRSCCELGTRRSWEGTIKRQNASTWPASRQSTLERHRKKPATIFTKQHVHDVHENVWMHERHGPAGPP